MPELERVVGNTFRTETVDIDGKQFINCVFDRCVLRFSGIDVAGFRGCKFIDHKWLFAKHAEATFEFLRLLYQGFGAEGEQVVEEVFNKIRRETPPPQTTPSA